MNRGGGDEKVVFEDWKRNPYAFPVEDIIHFQNNPAQFYIVKINVNNQGNLGGTFLGISAETIENYNSTPEEFFNINSDNFNEVTDEDTYADVLFSAVLTNSASIANRKEQFSITDDVFQNFSNKYNLSYLESNTITKLVSSERGEVTYKILLLKFVDKDNDFNIFYTTGLIRAAGRDSR